MKKFIIIISIVFLTLSAIYFLKYNTTKKVPDSAILVYLKEELKWL
ncbi:MULTISPECIES: hypothetical protein [Thermoanaerobacterium]|jgi:hypothetical protein|uniref:Uncharacterized protein n=1 Tax=Thermoanaerobacterium thermosaccharolyticum TaxID=1517 RepID=A0A223I308_THETR|nr:MULTISPECIES: hypothetical protein [Thermoanaerobacterium]MDI3477449.1 hypothetical protein [Thermoanaerobacterium sp.]TCW37230.1 hypothetical protein EDC21_10831 [Thermohydrogenium kirishiense]AST59111.1 uncharacterized protein Thert_03382 [Thermoanaerobacterium thermosaccharolyticum]MCP2239281.1 hypothetical protein [Thermoanaerobacterium thermosaccharolyticum]WHE08063.1 hypothetical protein PGH24_04790 [Thermoanaerobacterium thermosaccharolyticum]